MFSGMESNESIVHISISDMVANKLRYGIMNGTFKSNQKLIETDLCKIMEVSRTPIRKAFNVLVEEGLLERIEGYGVIVAYTDMESSYYWEVLESLERVAMEKAIHNTTDVDLSELKIVQNELEEKWNNLKQSVEVTSSEWKDLGKIDMDFHNIVVRASGNPLIDEYIVMICQKGNITNYMKNISEDSILEHRIMIKAIEEKNIVMADNTIRQHFE